MEAGQNKEGNWPVYLQSLLQSLTAAAQSRPRVQPAVHASQPGHQVQATPTISVLHLQQVCDHNIVIIFVTVSGKIQHVAKFMNFQLAIYLISSTIELTYLQVLD